MGKFTHDLELSKLGLATGQSASGDRSLKDASNAHSSRGGSVSMKHFLIDGVDIASPRFSCTNTRR